MEEEGRDIYNRVTLAQHQKKASKICAGTDLNYVKNYHIVI
jgi:hypothetical protein